MRDTIGRTRTGDAVGFRPWLAVASVATAAFVVITTEFLPIGLLGTIAAEVHVSLGTAGWMVAIPGIVAATAAPALMLLTNKVDRRLLLVGFAALVMLSNVIVALSCSFAVILVGRVLLGVCVGGFWTFAVAVGRRLVPASDGSRATAIILAGVSIGTVVGLPIGTALAELAGWRFAFGCVAGFAGLTVLCQGVLLFRLPTPEVTSIGLFKGLFKIPEMRIGFLASALTAAGHFAAYTYLQPYLFRIVHLAPSATTWVLAASGSAGIVGTFAGERAASHNLRWTFFGTAILLGSAIIMAAVLNGNCVTAIAAVVIWGAAFGAVPVCTRIWTYRSAPERFEPASAMGIAIFQIALAAGSFGGGAVVDHAGVLPAFLLGGALSLSCGLLLLLTQAPSEV